MAPPVGKCLCIITGASKGFGKTVAQLICQDVGILSEADKGSKIVLIARCYDELEHTKASILKNAVHPENFCVDLLSIDFEQVAAVESTFSAALSDLEDYETVVLFSNAGSIGDVTKTLAEHDNILDIQNYFNINVVSPMFIISSAMKRFASSKCTVVNTSTLAALQPFRYSGLYASAKACMDMFLRNLAADCPNIRTLNYAPGPMDTNMARTLMENSGDEGTRNYFQKMFNDGSIVKCVDSALKLMSILKEDKYESGTHIDFFD